MTVTIAVWFPLGRYHATPWNRSVNEGATEWPPSPWRLLRALTATWHTRWPGLPAAVFDHLLDALSDPPSYRTPPSRPAHTRHYLPDLDHKKGETGGTDLTLDPFLSLPRETGNGGVSDEETALFIQWPARLDTEQREALAKLAELLPYLGRAESVCQARLLDHDPVPDETWWRPGSDGPQRRRLLCPAQPVSRATLEMTTTQVRKQRRTLPPGTIWVDYTSAGQHQPSPAAQRPAVPPVQAIRFAVTGQVPLKATHGVLLADRAHEAAGGKLINTGCHDSRRRVILGTGGALTDHRHAHWLPLAKSGQPGASVEAMVLWVPLGLRTEEVAAILSLRKLSGQRGSAYEVRGFPEVRLLFQAAGTIQQVAPELCHPARHWRSLTPYLPVRHRKRKPLADYLSRDVAAELDYRGLPSAVIHAVNAEEGLPDRWAREFRRYRLSEEMDKSRPGLRLRLEFGQKVCGPVVLGQLSHFGYGIFTPDGQ
jgi:CRISPR-associated protein Csb2